MEKQELPTSLDEKELAEHVKSQPLEGDWAQPRERLAVDRVPEGFTAMNIDGRPAIGALQGFGQLWKKTYKVRLAGLDRSAAEVMGFWKEHFPELQPAGNKFYPPEGGLEAGKLMFIDSPLPIVPPMYKKPGVVPMNSGVMIMYVDDESFAVMTPEGFPVAGWNNFSVYEEDEALVAQVQSFERASDPIYEFGFRFMAGAKRQEFIWIHVLTSLAERLGIQAQVSMTRECLDPGLQWNKAGKVWQNAGVRTTLYRITFPFRWIAKQVRG